MSTASFELEDWFEGRRMRAFELSQQGWRPVRIAEALGVSRAAASQWLERARRGGADALRARPRLGASARLTQGQRALIPEVLSHGAEAYGFRGAVWTCDRVATVIAREFGVRYHKAHVSRILKQLGWTPQQPITRAIQRDDDAIERWREGVWPELKKSRGATTAG
jgi:transposase